MQIKRTRRKTYDTVEHGKRSPPRRGVPGLPPGACMRGPGSDSLRHGLRAPSPSVSVGDTVDSPDQPHRCHRNWPPAFPSLALRAFPTGGLRRRSAWDDTDLRG